LKLRQQAYLAVQQMGADPASIQVFVEIDVQTSVVRATATGAASVIDQNMSLKAASADEIRKTVAVSMDIPEDEVKIGLRTNDFTVYKATEKASLITIASAPCCLRDVRALTVSSLSNPDEVSRN
jgi:hypothetical protein